MATITACGSSLLHCRIHRSERFSSSIVPSLSVTPPPGSRRLSSLSLSGSGKERGTRSAVMAADVEEEKETVSVPVSPSDMLTMFFKAEGMMDDSSVSKVSKALEEIEGITDLRIQIDDGIGSIELTKQTTVQATGVASNLVEVIQGSGFKLQTLNLSFEDEEDALN